MRKIINGKKYDTETAKELCGHWNGLGEGDFNNVQEDLYRKKTGEYFMRGIGGAMTDYAVDAYGGGWCGSSRIMPLSEQEARAFAEQHTDAAEFEAIFGEVSE